MLILWREGCLIRFVWGRIVLFRVYMLYMVDFLALRPHLSSHVISTHSLWGWQVHVQSKC